MKITTNKRNWLTPLSIPARKSGEYQIEHLVIPAGQKVMLNNTRNILLGGQKTQATNIVYDADTTWHRLIGPSGVWMSDLPVEQRQMEECIKGMKGNILVGGLGLGLAAKLLSQRKMVKNITVVEASKEVIRLVEGSAHNIKVQIICTDLFHFLEKLPNKSFDYAFYDIWQSDSEHTFFNVVCPLIRMSQWKVKHRPVNWNEQVMRGQLFQSLQNKLLVMRPEVRNDPRDPWKNKIEHLKKNPPWEKKGDIWHDWQVEYWSWHHDKQPDEELATRMAEFYSLVYGTWVWETKWMQATKGDI